MLGTGQFGARPSGRRQEGLSRLPFVILAIALALIGLQLLAWWIGVQTGGGLEEVVVRRSDFAPTLTGALLIREGNGRHLYDLAAQRAAQGRIAPSSSGTVREMVNIYNHPPFEAFLGAVLLDLPYSMIFVVWTLAGVVAFGAGLAILAAAVPLSGPSRVAMIGAACAYFPVHSGFWLGQNSAFVFLGLCGTFSAWKHRRDDWLGVSLLLVGLKPQVLPLVVLLLLLQRRWRALVVAGLTTAVLSVAAMPILGVQWPLHYLEYLATVSNSGKVVAEHPELMYNWRGLLVNVIGEHRGMLIILPLLVLSLATVGTVVWAWWNTRRPDDLARRSTTQGELLFALVCIATIPVAPHLMAHDLLLLIVPAWIVGGGAASIRGESRFSRNWNTCLWIGWLLPVCTYFTIVGDAASVVATVILLGIAAMLLLIQIHARRNDDTVILSPPAAHLALEATR